MKIIVVGATGATGKHLVRELLDQGHQVKAFVRSPEKLKELNKNVNLELVKANVLETPIEDLQQHVADCDAVASCLGHNPDLKGLYGHPRKLVTETVARWCAAIEANRSDKPVKYVLMNTAGNSNRDLNEPVSFGQRVVVGLLRLLVPPHRDNEMAADHLRTAVGQDNPYIEWVAVRPDSLQDEPTVTPYEIHRSPIRSVIFDPGNTSRINVAHFMAQLITNKELWEKWKGEMPVIYNSDREAVPS